MAGAMYTHFAPNFTTNTLGADRTITATSIHVYGITIASSSASTRIVTIEDTAGNAYMTIVIAADTTVIMDIPFLAGAGLVMNINTDDALVIFTAFHSALTGSA